MIEAACLFWHGTWTSIHTEPELAFGGLKPSIFRVLSPQDLWMVGSWVTPLPNDIPVSSADEMNPILTPNKSLELNLDHEHRTW